MSVIASLLRSTKQLLVSAGSSLFTSSNKSLALLGAARTFNVLPACAAAQQHNYYTTSTAGRGIGSPLLQCNSSFIAPGPISGILQGPASSTIGPVSVMQVRHKQYRDFWPRPCELKRVKKGGYDKRRRHINGRVKIMKKIIKGCWILAH